MDFKNYVEIAKKKNNLISDRQVAKCLNISCGAINHFISGKSTPSPDTVLKIGKLAGLDEKTVLIDYLLFKYGKYENVKNVLKILK